MSDADTVNYSKSFLVVRLSHSKGVNNMAGLFHKGQTAKHRLYFQLLSLIRSV